jgi:hypothetical protein
MLSRHNSVLRWLPSTATGERVRTHEVPQRTGRHKGTSFDGNLLSGLPLKTIAPTSQGVFGVLFGAEEGVMIQKANGRVGHWRGRSNRNASHLTADSAAICRHAAFVERSWMVITSALWICPIY